MCTDLPDPVVQQLLLTNHQYGHNQSTTLVRDSLLGNRRLHRTHHDLHGYHFRARTPESTSCCATKTTGPTGSSFSLEDEARPHVRRLDCHPQPRQLSGCCLNDIWGTKSRIGRVSQWSLYCIADAHVSSHHSYRMTYSSASRRECRTSRSSTLRHQHFGSVIRSMSTIVQLMFGKLAKKNIRRC